MLSSRFVAPLCFAVFATPAFALGQDQPPAIVQPVSPASATAPVEIKIQTANREYALGQPVRAKIEVKNQGKQWLTLKQVTLGGGQLVSDLTGKNVGPGKTVTWSGEVQPEMLTTQELGPAQVQVLVETEAGSASAKLTLTRVDPYKVEIRYDPRPVSGGADNMQGDFRVFSVAVMSRKPGTGEATVSVRIPDGWKLVEGKTPDTRTLLRSGDTRRIGYKVLVPLAAPLGEYPLEATVSVGGRTYNARAIIAVTR